MITIKEIAAGLNVSPTTVSNVIHGNLKRVSPENVERISKRLKELNYIPNMGARMLANGDSKIIGVIMHSINDENGQMDKYSIAHGNFNSMIFSVLEREIRQLGFYMMFYEARNVEEILTVVKTWNIDGLIVWGLMGEKCQFLSGKIACPTVFIDGCFEPRVSCANIGLYDTYGGYLATLYLLENGHREIAFVTDALPIEGVSKERYKGYRQALKEYGCSEEQETVLYLPKRKTERMKYYEHWYQNWPKVTAFFFDSDYYAVEAMNFFMDKGVKIPEEMSVVGFDDNAFSRIVRPQLTTIHQNVAEKGVQAVQQLHKLMKNMDMPNRTIMLPVQLMVRGTVKDINSK